MMLTELQEIHNLLQICLVILTTFVSILHIFQILLMIVTHLYQKIEKITTNYEVANSNIRLTFTKNLDSRQILKFKGYKNDHYPEKVQGKLQNYENVIINLNPNQTGPYEKIDMSIPLDLDIKLNDSPNKSDDSHLTDGKKTLYSTKNNNLTVIYGIKKSFKYKKLYQ